MEIEYSSHFRKVYQNLTLKTQKKAEKKEAIFRKSPFDPRLKTHKLRGKLKEFYSLAIDQKYRIVFKLVNRFKAVFLDIGDHDIYR